MADDLQEQLTDRDKWLRLLYIVLYVVLFYLAALVLAVVVAIQFLWHLFSGEPHDSLREFGQRMGRWLAEMVDYSTYASDARPWPFGIEGAEGGGLRSINAHHLQMIL